MSITLQSRVLRGDAAHDRADPGMCQLTFSWYMVACNDGRFLLHGMLKDNAKVVGGYELMF